MSDSSAPARNGAGQDQRADGAQLEDQASNTTQDSQDQSPQSGRGELIVRYGLMRSLGRFHHELDQPPPSGCKVVVRTDRGVELGEVVAAIGDDQAPRSIGAERLASYLECSGPDYPFAQSGKVLRLANRQDIIDDRHLQQQARQEAAFCREQVARLGLAMKIITVEHLLGGERIIFYFTAESRVDFRELVRKLAAQYRTRIEMRQVGARDEARLVGDYERCGLRCCCQEFLKHLKPVSMRMAKTQKATLDPSKISGRCGRLMCCLRYEDQTYEELRKLLPKKNTWVRTAERVGKVIETQIITQLVKIQSPDGSIAVVHNEEIIERDVDPSAATAEVQHAQAGEPVVEEQSSRLAAEQAGAAGGQGASPPGPDQPPRSRRRGRRRRKRKKRATASAGRNAPQDAPGQAQQQSRKARKSSKRRRRRRRPPKNKKKQQDKQP